MWVHGAATVLEATFAHSLNMIGTPVFVVEMGVGMRVTKEYCKLTPFIDIEEEQLLLPSIPNCEMGRWHPAFVDVTAKGNTKQRGIDEIIRHFGIRLEETMAFGDGGNDISMLRHAGIGVAMGNAKDDVKAAAGYVTTSVDDNGIANALKQYGIIES